MIEISGKKINALIGERLKQEIEETRIVPSLGILSVGKDEASKKFINVKKQFGEKYGFQVNIVSLEENYSFELVKGELQNLILRNDGVIVQLPLPDDMKIFTKEIINMIPLEKDVDCLRERNDSFEAPIVLAFLRVLEEVGVWAGKNIFSRPRIAIVGLGQVVGLPIRDYCQKQGYKIFEIGKDNYEDIKKAEIVVSGVGMPEIIKPENISLGSILIDYGCSYIDGVAYGDFDKACYQKSSFFTPVPGCMGPLVVASLFENVLKSAEKKNMI